MIVNGDHQRASLLYDNEIYKKEVKKRNARVVVVGISGGIDSAVTVSLAKAIGPEKVFGLILPDSSVTPKRDTTHALEG